MTREEVVKVLRFRQGENSLRTFAKEIGCSAAYLSDVFKGRRDPAKTILGFLGLTKERTVRVVYHQTINRKAKR